MDKILSFYQVRRFTPNNMTEKIKFLPFYRFFKREKKIKKGKILRCTPLLRDAKLPQPPLMFSKREEKKFFSKGKRQNFGFCQVQACADKREEEILFLRYFFFFFFSNLNFSNFPNLNLIYHF